MELKLIRDVKTKQSTTGKLYVNDKFECFMLEDRDRGLKSDMPLEQIMKIKIKHETCIPSGRYQVIIDFSNRFQKLMPLVCKVPGYEGIRIHPGNYASNTSGCLLPGTARTADEVHYSRMAFDKLYQKIKEALDKKERVWITIE